MRNLKITIRKGADLLYENTFFSAPVTLGRGKARDIILDFDFVSRLHCTFFQIGGKWILKDHSASGVLLAGKRVDQLELDGTQTFVIEGHSVLEMTAELVG